MNRCTQQANRQYSQNRLRRRLLRRPLARSSIDKGDLVYDIGAGDGVITLELARRGARVIAVEKDEKLYMRLCRKISGCEGITLQHQDFLSVALPQHVPYKVFSNIPFTYTSPIVRKLFFDSCPPVDSYLVIQKEAAGRYAGIGRECLVSLLLKPQFRFTVLFAFSPRDFFPVPGVDIVLLRIETRRRSLICPRRVAQYRDFVTHGLCSGKPTIKGALNDWFSHTQFKRLSKGLGFSPFATPAELSFQQWLGLFRFMVVRQSWYLENRTKH